METHERFSGTDSMAELLRRWCEAVYPVPNPLRSAEEWGRRQHEDLAGLGLPELCLELTRLQLRLVVDRSPDPWLLERLRVLREAIANARR